MGDDEARRILLARRARFIAAALASVAATGTVVVAGTEGCGGDSEQTDAGQPEPCLAPIVDSGATDGGGQTDTGPQPCLKIAPDAGPDAKKDADAEPQPCLSLPIDGG